MNKFEWIEKCNEWKSKWPVISQDHFLDKDGIDIYAVLHYISKYSKSEDIIMGDAGSISYTGPVAIQAKQNQRFIFSPAQADMGWCLPSSIGVALSSKKQVIAIIGDGSFMSNIQELAVVKEHQPNIKFIILNNSGYLSIRNTQSRFYKRVHGVDSNSGLWFPKFSSIAKTFEIDYTKIKSVKSLSKLKKILKQEGPMIVDIRCKFDQQILPSQTYRDGKQAPLHDMAPLLDKEEIEAEMFFKCTL